MDLLDDFDRVRATFSEAGGPGAQRHDASLADDGLLGPGSSGMAGPSTSYSLPGLSVEPAVRQAAR
jgi:hypothetical protein